MIAKKINNSGFIAFLLLLIITIGLLSYQNYLEYSELKHAFKLEKKELELELNNVIKNYEDALYDKDAIYLILREKLHHIIKLKDTINNLKTSDYKLFRFYRKRISSLTEQNKILFKQIDSLKLKNNKLLFQNKEVYKILEKKRNKTFS
ncbi:hypothetical protein [Tenacibaculum aestuariivivum]|uniref:hypothetical protein n=1 Tax=Tenacibaculum aestuariivivum TaxID=2006131 RepID=UPI003AB32D92